MGTSFVEWILGAQHGSIASHDKTCDRVNEVARLGDIMLISLAQTAKHGGLGGARSTNICSSRRVGVGANRCLPLLNQAWRLSTEYRAASRSKAVNGRSDRTVGTAESFDGMRDVERLQGAQQVQLRVV